MVKKMVGEDKLLSVEPNVDLFQLQPFLTLPSHVEGFAC